MSKKRQPRSPKRGVRQRVKVISVGQFASGIEDLASNKAHLKGFGR